jgi:hypothetical protein
LPRRGIGFQIANTTCANTEGRNAVGYYLVTENYAPIREVDGLTTCFPAADGKLNRFKVVVSTTRVEITVTDPNNPTATPIKALTVTGLNLKFTRGYVHLQHSQYNANKTAQDGTPYPASSSQTYRWDNVAFDGPTFPKPRGYDVPDELKNYSSEGATGKSFGYYLSIVGEGITPKTVTVPGVDLTDAVSATFNFNLFAQAGERLRFRFNGKAWHEFQVPSQVWNASESNLRGFSVPVPLEDLVAGNNRLELTLADEAPFHTAIGNMDLTIQPSK